MKKQEFIHTCRTRIRILNDKEFYTFHWNLKFNSLGPGCLTTRVCSFLPSTSFYTWVRTNKKIAVNSKIVCNSTIKSTNSRNARYRCQNRKNEFSKYYEYPKNNIRHWQTNRDITVRENNKKKIDNVMC